MARLTLRSENSTLDDPGSIEAFLKDYHITYQSWDVSRLSEAPKPEDESEQDHILRIFSDEVEQLKRQGGYQTADVIALYPETPNLQELLAKFRSEHHHTEDEVRFVVQGRGVFTIHGQDDRIFDIEVLPGDLLIVPAGTWHWFDLCEDKTIQCIRLFSNREGWIPVYRNQEGQQ